LIAEGSVDVLPLNLTIEFASWLTRGFSHSSIPNYGQTPSLPLPFYYGFEQLEFSVLPIFELNVLDIIILVLEWLFMQMLPPKELATGFFFEI